MKEIDPEKYELFCAYIYDKRYKEFPLYEQAKEKGIPAYRIMIGSPYSPLLIPKIRKLMRDLDIGIIHTHGYKSDIAGALAGIGKNVKKITTVHGFVETDEKLKIYNCLNLYAFRFFDQVITVNQPQKDYLIQYGVNGEKITVIHNGVDPEEFSRDRVDSDIRKELGISYDAHVLLYLGRLSREKGAHNLVPAVKQIVKEFPDVVLLIAGTGPEKDNLEMNVHDERLGANICFLGYRKDNINLLGESDILILPSRTEGIPNSVLEAMSMELPVVATKVGGTPEIMDDGKEGFVVPPEKPAELANAVIKVLKNPLLAKKMGKSGRERVLRELSFSMRMRKIEDVYDQLLK